MRDKLLSHYRKFGPRRFVLFTVLTLALTDLINSWYLRLWWVAKDMSGMGVRMTAEKSNIALADLGPDTIREVRAMFDNMFFLFLLIILVNNFFFYAFYYRRKLWAQGFVLFYALTAAGLSFVFLFDNAGLGTGWYLYNLLMSGVYLYLFVGVKVLKEETVDLPGSKEVPPPVPTPERETTEQ